MHIVADVIAIRLEIYERFGDRAISRPYFPSRLATRTLLSNSLILRVRPVVEIRTAEYMYFVKHSTRTAAQYTCLWTVGESRRLGRRRVVERVFTDASSIADQRARFDSIDEKFARITMGGSSFRKTFPVGLTLSFEDRAYRFAQIIKKRIRRY